MTTEERNKAISGLLRLILHEQITTVIRILVEYTEEYRTA